MLELSNDFLARTPKAQEIIADARIMKAYQNQLAETDYQIIKCYEYSMVGLELPYDIEELHATREYLREEIRKIEEKMS